MRAWLLLLAVALVCALPSERCQTCEDAMQTYHDRYRCAGEFADWGNPRDPDIRACEMPSFSCEQIPLGIDRTECLTVQVEMQSDAGQLRLLWQGMMDHGRAYQTCSELGYCDPDEDYDASQLTPCHRALKACDDDSLCEEVVQACTPRCRFCNLLMPDWPMFWEYCVPPGAVLRTRAPTPVIQAPASSTGTSAKQQATGGQQTQKQTPPPAQKKPAGGFLGGLFGFAEQHAKVEAERERAAGKGSNTRFQNAAEAARFVQQQASLSSDVQAPNPADDPQMKELADMLGVPVAQLNPADYPKWDGGVNAWQQLQQEHQEKQSEQPEPQPRFQQRYPQPQRDPNDFGEGSMLEEQARPERSDSNSMLLDQTNMVGKNGRPLRPRETRFRMRFAKQQEAVNREAQEMMNEAFGDNSRPQQQMMHHQVERGRSATQERRQFDVQHQQAQQNPHVDDRLRMIARFQERRAMRGSAENQQTLDSGIEEMAHKQQQKFDPSNPGAHFDLGFAEPPAVAASPYEKVASQAPVQADKMDPNLFIELSSESKGQRDSTHGLQDIALAKAHELAKKLRDESFGVEKAPTQHARTTMHERSQSHYPPRPVTRATRHHSDVDDALAEVETQVASGLMNRIRGKPEPKPEPKPVPSSIGTAGKTKAKAAPWSPKDAERMRECFRVYDHVKSSRKAKYFASWKRYVTIMADQDDRRGGSMWDANVACKCLGFCELGKFEDLGLVQPCAYDAVDDQLMQFVFGNGTTVRRTRPARPPSAPPLTNP